MDWPQRGLVLAVLGLVLSVAYLVHGGPTSEARTVMHLGLAVTLGFVLAAPTAMFRVRGLFRRVAMATAVVFGMQATGLLPLPAFLGRWVSPSWTFDRGEVSWDWSSLDVAATLSAMTTTALVVGVAAAMLAAQPSRRWLIWVVRGIGVGVLCVGMVGPELGLPYPGNTPPFVDTNHFGAALVLCFPAILGPAVSRSTPMARRAVAAVFGAVIIASLVWRSSMGPSLICLFLSVLVLVRSRLLGPLAAAGLAVVALPFLIGAGDRGGMSHGRLPIWRQSLSGLKDHWLFGSGSGTFGKMVEPYRTDTEFHTWVHAHNDWLEWIVEGGVVALIAVPVVLLILARPLKPKRQLPEDRRLLGLGLLGFLAQALLEFPMHLPFLAMSFAAVWGLWAGAFHQQGVTSPSWGRGLVGGLLVANVAGALFHARLVVVENAERSLRTDASERSRLVWLDSDNARMALFDVRTAVVDVEPEKAAELLESVVQENWREAGVVRSAAGMALAMDLPAAGLRYADRARTLGPADKRNWELWARASSTVAPQDASDAWMEALNKGFAFEKEAWSAMPEGIVWATRMSELTPEAALRMAKVLSNRDPLAAVFAYEAIRWDRPNLVPLLYVRSLHRSDRHADAERAWSAMARHDQRSKRGLELRVEIALAMDDLRTAAEAWRALYDKTDDVKYRTRAISLMVATSPAQDLVDQLVKIDKTAAKLTKIEALILADAQRRTGNSTACVKTLASRDYGRAKRGIQRKANRLQARCGRVEDPPVEL